MPDAVRSFGEGLRSVRAVRRFLEETLKAHGKSAELTFGVCQGECCGIEYMAALERGQTSRFISDAADVPSVTYRPSYVDGPSYTTRFYGAGRKQAVFQAPWSGWFDIRFELPGSRPRGWIVRWELDR